MGDLHSAFSLVGGRQVLPLRLGLELLSLAGHVPARANPGTPTLCPAAHQVLSLPQMLELLKWGLVSGVDDGCEPTPDEVSAEAARTVYRPPTDE